MSRSRRRRSARAISRGVLTRGIRSLLSLLAALFLLGSLSFLSWLLLIYPNERAGTRAETVRLVIEPDTSFDHVVDALVAHHVLDDPKWFDVYARIVGGEREMRQGLVLVSGELSIREILQRISAAFPAVTVRLTVPEGFTRFDVAKRMSELGICTESAFLDASRDPGLMLSLGLEHGESFEGYLFPDTYAFRQTSSPSIVVQKMVENADRRFSAIAEEHSESMAALQREFGWTRFEVVTLASIVEKEAAVAAERPVIARVFLNRLRSETFLPRHRLQADPTISYGCLARPEAAPSCTGFDGRISSAMQLDSANLYNTYRHAGLPPGPIANPGLDAIRAVLSPAEHRYLFFVVRGGGRHEFSETHEQHLEAVQRYRERQRE